MQFGCDVLIYVSIVHVLHTQAHIHRMLFFIDVQMYIGERCLLIKLQLHFSGLKSVDLKLPLVLFDEAVFLSFHEPKTQFLSDM